MTQTGPSTPPPRRALLSGGTGYTGRHLIRALLSAGWEVDVLIRPSTGVADIGPSVDDVGLLRWDGNADGLVPIVRSSRPDVVFHLAGVSGYEYGLGEIEMLVWANVTFGTLLAEAATASGCSAFVCTGTAWTHRGNAAYSPVSLYAATKKAFEMIMQYYVEACSWRCAVVELVDSYGPADPRAKLMSVFADAADTGQPAPMSEGTQLIDLMHIDDVALGLVAAADLVTRGAPRLERWRLTSGHALSVREIHAIFERCAGVKAPVVWGARPARARELENPPTCTDVVPGWRAVTPLEVGIRLAHPAPSEADQPGKY